MNSETVNILWSDRVTGIRIRENGKTKVIEGTDFVSSMPIRELIARFEPGCAGRSSGCGEQAKLPRFFDGRAHHQSRRVSR